MQNLKFFIFSLLILTTLQNLKQKTEQYLSPEQAEEAYVETLQNHKDDEEIYEFGLAGQQDPELKKKILLKFGEDFPLLMESLQKISHMHNKNMADLKVLSEEASDNNKEVFNPQLLQQQQDYSLARKFYNFANFKQTGINEEIAKFFEEIDIITLSSDDLIKALDLEEEYNFYVNEIDQIDPTFKKIKREMELVTFDFAQSIRSFISSLDIMTDFFTFGGMLILQKNKTFDVKDPENILNKVNFGVDLLNQLFQIKGDFDYFFSQIAKGASEMLYIRENMLYLFTKLEPIRHYYVELRKEKEGLEKSLNIPLIFVSLLSIVFLFQLI